MPEPAQKRRRIPEDQRKRSLQSCDLCRKRRCKCIRPPDSDTCQACRQSKSICTWTAPTKTRFYGSVEDLSDRYRCMEAIIRGAFPNDSIESTADLVSLGERMGFEMPDLSYRPPVKIEELVRAPPTDAPVTNNNSGLSTRRGSPERDISVSATADKRPSATARLVRDSAGNSHYIGPSGSLSFFAELRDLVSSYQKNEANDGAASTSPFALDNVAKALETEGNQEEDINEDVPKDDEPGRENIASPNSVISALSNNTAGTTLPDLDEVLKQLPPSEVMETLTESYFDNVHSDIPLFHRATFQDQYETFVLRARNARFRAQNTPFQNQTDHQSVPRPDWGWLACLHMMLVFGSLSNPKSSQSNYTSLRRTSLSISNSLLPHLATKCSLTNIQALLLLSFYSHNNNERNAAWVLVGTATRMSFALGLHQNDLDSLFRPIERETRKRVWSTLFAFEQFLCSTLGRPSGIGDPEVDVRVPSQGLLDDADSAGIGFAEESLKLTFILALARQVSHSRPHGHIYSSQKRRNTGSQSLTRGKTNHPTPTPSVKEVLRELESWQKELPLHLQLSPFQGDATNSVVPENPFATVEQLRMTLCRQTPRQIRALVLLHIRYHYIVTLVTRSSLLLEIASSTANSASGLQAQGALIRNGTPAKERQSSNHDTWSHAVMAVSSASQMATLILLLDDFSLLNGTSGLDVFYAYSAAMVLLLRTLLVRDARNYNDDLSLEADKTRSLRRLVGKLRDAVSKINKSRTMKRFATVMDKFAGAIDGIGKTASTFPMADTATPKNNVQTTPYIQQTGIIPPNMGEIPASLETSTFSPATNLEFATEPQNPNHVSSRNPQYQATADTFNNSSLLPSPASSSQLPFFAQTAGTTPQMNNMVSNQAFPQNPDLWYEDPLDALANGYIINWTDIDAFVEGI